MPARHLLVALTAAVLTDIPIVIARKATAKTVDRTSSPAQWARAVDAARRWTSRLQAGDPFDEAGDRRDVVDIEHRQGLFGLGMIGSDCDDVRIIWR